MSTFITRAAAAQREPMSAGLARVLAEAADGYRTGRPVWVIASSRAPYEIRGVDEDSARAWATAAKSGSGYGAYGPFITPPDSGSAGRPQVTEVRVLARRPDGSVDTTFVDPQEYDAVFWSVAAVDKFLVPYYARVHGAPTADAFRRGLLRDGAFLWPHVLFSITLGSRWNFRPPRGPQQK